MNEREQSEQEEEERIKQKIEEYRKKIELRNKPVVIKRGLSEELEKKIFDLKPGESFTIGFDGTMSIETFRNRIYSFLHHEDSKQDFKIKKSGNTLKVIRLRPSRSYFLEEAKEEE